MKINRLLEIVIILMKEKDVTVKYLAEQFDVSKKTIYRDLETLIISHVPIVYGEEMKGKVKILEGFSLNYLINKNYKCKNENPFVIDYRCFSPDYSDKQRLLKSDFIKHKPIDTKDVRREILQSWHRCRQSGTSLFTLDLKYCILPNEKDQYMFKEGHDQESQLFMSMLKYLNWDAAVYDANGQLKEILWINESFDKIGYVRDAREYAIGTNAIHLSLIENKLSYIVGAEHFKSVYEEYVSVGVPIYKENVLFGTILVFFSLPLVDETIKSIYSLARFYEMLILRKESLVDPLDAAPLMNMILPEKSEIDLMGQSAIWNRLKKSAENLFEVNEPILIKGEKGTGKKTLARWMHENSYRSNGPYVEIDGSDVNVENSLFSHILESAIGGTIVLCNVHLLPVAIQKKLYQFMISKVCINASNRKNSTLDIRLIICMPLKYELALKLKAEIELMQLRVPNLKERENDVSLIARNHMEPRLKAFGLKAFDFEIFYKRLEACDWKNNLTSLFNFLDECHGLVQSIHHKSSKDIIDQFEALIDNNEYT